MKQLFALLTFLTCQCLIENYSYAQQANVQWALGMGGTGVDEGYSVSIDPLGNILTTGTFKGTIDFDPGPGTSLLTTGANSEIFIAKFDPAGNLIWAKKIGGSGSSAYALAVDSLGNVYTSGTFSGTADFNPGLAQYNLTSAGLGDMFVSKLDAFGNFVWAKQFKTNSLGVNSYDLTIDDSGNVYTTGRFRGTVDFDPGIGVYNITSMTSAIFISKLNASGDFVWSISVGDSGEDIGYGIDIDASGYIYATGIFEGTVDFDPGAVVNFLTCGAYEGVYIAKFGSGGNLVWAKQFSGSANIYLSNPKLVLDSAGSIYCTGEYSGNVDFDPGTSNYILPGDQAIYISKLDSSGNFIWAKSIKGSNPGTGGNNSIYQPSLAVDIAGNVQVAGKFFGEPDFDPGPGINKLAATNNNTSDIFILKLNNSGDFIWANKIGGMGSDYANCIIGDKMGNSYITGGFDGWGSPVDFDFNTGTNLLTSAGIQDIFLLKISQSVLPLNVVGFSAKATSIKHIELAWQIAQSESINKFLVERSSNLRDFSSVGMVNASGNNIIKNYSFTDVNPIIGSNFYRLKIYQKNGSFTYSEVKSVYLSSDKRLSIFPNPVKDVLQIRFSGENETGILKIVDASGKIVIQQPVQLSGYFLLPINVKGLESGRYSLLLETVASKKLLEFIKL